MGWGYHIFTSGRGVINMMVLLRSLSHCVTQGRMNGWMDNPHPHPLSNCYQKESRQKSSGQPFPGPTRGTITIIIIKWNNIMWVVLQLLLLASLGFGNKILNFVRCCFCMGLNDMAWDHGTGTGLEHVLTMCDCCHGYAIIICRTFKNISYSHTPGKSQTHPSIQSSPSGDQEEETKWWWWTREEQEKLLQTIMFFQAKQNAVNGFVTHIVATNKECPVQESSPREVRKF